MNEESHVPSKFFLLSRSIILDLSLVILGLYAAFVNDFGLFEAIGIGKHSLWLIGAWNTYRRLKTWQAIGKEGGKPWYRSKTIRDNLFFIAISVFHLWYAWQNGMSAAMPLLSIWFAGVNIWLRVAYTRTRVYPFTGA